MNRPAAQKVVQHAPPSRPRPLEPKEEIRQAFGKGTDRQAPTKNTAAAKDSEEPKFKSEVKRSPSLSAETLTREYFTGHSSPVLLLGFVGQGGQMISLDADGLLLEWLYDSTHLSSYGWFTPRRSIQLGLALRMSCPDATSDATSVQFPTVRPSVRQQNDRTKKSVEKKAAEKTSSSLQSAAYLRAVQTPKSVASGRCACPCTRGAWCVMTTATSLRCLVSPRTTRTRAWSRRSRATQVVLYSATRPCAIIISAPVAPLLLRLSTRLALTSPC